MRLRIDLAYDGTDFHGWAVQPGLRTVQGELEAALATVLRERVSVTCAGRTDTGVHARGQVVHADVGGTDPGPLARRLNGLLPVDVRVRTCAEAAPGFDARFSALSRRYAYRITDGHSDPLRRRHVVSWPRRLDVTAMNAAAAALVGEHDFAAFCRRRDGGTTIRRLTALSAARDPAGDPARDPGGQPESASPVGGLVVTDVQADAFCHHMVRSVMGCLVAVGEGRRPADWAAQVLRARTRDPAVTVLPPHGLTLEEVRYPPEDRLALQADATRRVRSHG